MKKWLHMKFLHKMSINLKKTSKLSFQKLFTLINVKSELLLNMRLPSDALNLVKCNQNFKHFLCQITFLCFCMYFEVQIRCARVNVKFQKKNYLLQYFLV